MKSLSTIISLLLVADSLCSQIIFQQFPQTLQLYPRDVATNMAQVYVSGTAAGLGADTLVFTMGKSNGVAETRKIASNDLIADQFNLAFAITAGLWSYHLKVERQTSNALMLLQEATNLVAGDVFVVEGQSNAQAIAFNGDANIWQNNFVRCFGTSSPDVLNDENWYLAEGNGYFTPGAVGQWALRMGYLLQENLQIPIAIVNGADPGKPIEFFQRNDALHNDPASNYGRLLQRLTNAGLTNKIRALIYYQGESDGDRADIHKTLFEALHADWEEDFQNVEAYYVVQVREGCGAPSLQLREFQRAFEDYLHHVRAITANGINGHDGCHYDVLGYGALGEKIYKQISAELYNTPSGEQTNIRALSASFTNELNTQITVVTDAVGVLAVQPGSLSDFRIEGAAAAVIGIQADSNKLILELDQSVNIPNAGISYGGHTGSGAWVLNADGYGMFTFYNRLIGNYHEVPNFDIPGIMSGSGNCISLDGANDCVYIGPVLGSSYTKEAWVNWQGAGVGNNILSGSSNTAFWMPGGTLAAGHNGAWFQVADNVTIPPYQWAHVAVSYDAVLAEMRLYKNGSLVSAAQNVPPQNNDPELYIGAFGGGFTFQGKIDEVRVWNTVRSMDEIRANMCQKLSGDEAGLSAYFRFDETAGNTVPNMTSATDGQLLNFQGFGLNEAWKRSGAPIGTKSNYTYKEVDELILSIASGDSLVLSMTDVPDFVHLFFVEEVPNVLEAAEGYTLVDNARYFGLFYANQSFNQYDLKYAYGSNPFAFVQEQNLGLLHRRNNAQPYWEEAPQFQVNQAENTVSASGTTFQEYILAINDSVSIIPLSAQLAIAQPILCSGLNDGVVIATAIGGQPPYNFSLNGGSAQPVGLFNNLAPGAYSVVIMDHLGNSSTTNFVLLESPDPLEVSIGVSGNSASVEIEGGAPPYTFSSNAPNVDLQNLPNGSYSVTVLDANGCPLISTFTIDYDPLSFTAIVSDNHLCDGFGEISIIAQGGTSPYQYGLNNDIFQSINTFQDLPSGNYSVQVLDAEASLVEISNIVVNVPTAMQIQVAVMGGTITAAATGGVIPYLYRLNGGLPQTDSVFSNVPHGVYSIEVIDSVGCSITFHGIEITSGSYAPNNFWGIILTPNPSTGIFKIEGKNQTAGLTATVWDITGRLFYTFKMPALGSTFDLSGQPDGLYVLRITDGRRSENIRLIKLRG